MTNSGRIASLDTLRCIAILRVIAMHTVSRLHLASFTLLTFVLPGMPIVFAVSGAVSFASLTSGGQRARASFWRSRAHRLLWPYWTYAALVVILMMVADGLALDAWHAFDRSQIQNFLLPLQTPVACPAFARLGTHLWFLAPFVALLLIAPWGVLLHRRAPWLGAVVFALAAIVVRLAGWDLPAWIENTLAYGIAFQVGFGLADGRLRAIPRARLLIGSALLCAAGIAVFRVVGPRGTLNDVPIANVLVGLAWLGLLLAVQDAIEPVFRRDLPAALRRFVNHRAYTLFLWGPAANDFAVRIALRTAEGARAATHVALTVVGLVLVAWVFGRIEDRAAGRARESTAIDRVPMAP